MDSARLTEEQKIIRRRKAKKAKQRRTVFTVVLIICLFTAIGATSYFYFLYQNTLKQLDAEKAEYESLKEEMDSGSYITVEEAETLLNDAVDTAVEDVMKDADKRINDDYRERIRAFMEEGETLSMLEDIYSDMIVVPDTGRYVFFDIDESLQLSEVDYDAIEYPVENEDTGRYEGEATYSKGDVTAKKGIDVSKFQGDIDWNRVKNDGVEFAFIRLGYRGYESGKIVTDEKYEDNITGCNDAGIDCGVYFFTEALNEEEGREEADYVLELLDGHHVELPIVLDVEQSANTAKTRTKNLSQEDRTKVVIAFCERIKEAGYTPMIYGNLKSMMIMLDFAQLEEYEKWFAYYHYPLRFPYKHRIWQYSANGEVDGIKGSADMNLMFY
jgi:GH25 family lysozyme M1 (1,4-beta-N-acetylmuramidase)